MQTFDSKLTLDLLNKSQTFDGDASDQQPFLLGSKCNVYNAVAKRPRLLLSKDHFRSFENSRNVEVLLVLFYSSDVLNVTQWWGFRMARTRAREN
jgi:hypothetical protein